MHAINLLASFSVVLNALTGGSYRNTFSARVGYRSSLNIKWAANAEKAIDFVFGSGHCKKEYLNEIATFK